MALVLVAGAAGAHPATESTTRVTLRDAHLELTCEWDLFVLLGKTPTEVALLSEPDLLALHASLAERVGAQTHLEVDGAKATLGLRDFPQPFELRALAATLSAQGVEHGVLSRFRLESAALFPGARRITVRSPAALGPTFTSFVQPASAYVAPGGAAAFEVRGAPTPDSAPSWVVPAACLAVGLLLAGLSLARRTLSRRTA